MKHQDDMEDWSIGWYCIRAKPRMETVAAATLQTLDSVEVFLPRTIRPKKIKSTPIKPLFPGYFFARFDPEKFQCSHRYKHIQNHAKVSNKRQILCKSEYPLSRWLGIKRKIDETL